MTLCLDYPLILLTSTFSLKTRMIMSWHYKNCGYKTKIVYKTTDEISDVHDWGMNRTRKILWFTLPYNMAVANKLTKKFFKLLEKNSPTPSNNLNIQNIVYRMTIIYIIKLSYSCMPNIANLINKSNTKKLKNKL